MKKTESIITDWIPEAKAVELLNMKPRTLRQKIAASGPYAGQQPLPIVFSQIGRSYFYSEGSINKVKTQHANQ